MSVKLVAEPGVGTIAAGRGQGLCRPDHHLRLRRRHRRKPADLDQVRRHARGNWAWPRRTRRCVANDLRHKVRLQTDGGLKTGLDVIKAAILGAESFGFGTAPMVALGCKYLRICHLNNCATGVATQHETLRKEYFTGPAGDGDQLFPLRGAGNARADGRARRRAGSTELIGRTDLLEPAEGTRPRQKQLDLAPILDNRAGAGDQRPLLRAAQSRRSTRGRWPSRWSDDGSARRSRRAAAASGSYTITQHQPLDRRAALRRDRRPARQPGHGRTRRSTCASAAPPARASAPGTPAACTWCSNGDANDYVGKGMAGGKLVIRAPPGQ